MNENFIVYALTTGEILRTGGCPVDTIGFQGSEPGEWAIEGVADDLTQYIDINPEDPVVIDKPAMNTSLDTATIPADGTTLATITGIPAGATVTIIGLSFWQGVVNDGSVSITADAVGAYNVAIDLFPYLKQEYSIDAD